MKTKIPFVFLSAMLFIMTSFAQGSWTQKASCPLIPRYHANGFCIGNKGYIIFGAGDNVPNTVSFEEYDPSTNTWIQKPDFPGGERIKSQDFVINNILYLVSGAFWTVGLGYTGYHDMWKFDPVTSTWTQLNNFPGTPRHGGFSFAFNGKGYFGLGIDDNADILNDFWEYNPGTDSWTQKSNFPGTARKSGFQFSIEKYGYIGMGYLADMTQMNDVWQYDVSQDTWAQKNDFPTNAMSWVSNFKMNGKGYVVTGKKLDLNVNTTEFWEYNSLNDSWTSMPAFSGVARLAASGFSILGKGYTGLGYSDFYLNDFWEFTPSGYGVDQSDEKQKAEVNIYPNPSKTDVNISIENPEHEEITLDIYDAIGKCIKRLKSGNTSQLITADHSLFSVGVYYIAVSIGNKTIVKKLVIE